MAKTKRESRSRFVDTEFLRALGQHCKRLRKQRGLSIDRVSKESQKLSPSVIQRLETGSGPVSVLSLTRYAEVLGVPPSELISLALERAKTPQQPTVYPAEDPRAKKLGFTAWLPVYSARAAAGYFGSGEAAEPIGWMEAARIGKLDRSMFIVQIQGHSMEPQLVDGAYAVFRANPTGTRQGKIVLAQYRGPADPETGGSYTVKRYQSSKVAAKDGSWRHREITLSPINPEFEPISLRADREEDFRIVAEFIGIIG